MSTERGPRETQSLTAAGLPASDVERWRSAHPSFTSPAKASEASLPGDAEGLRTYVERGDGLAARLPTKPARTPA